jgi:hypothetical protein
VRAPDFAAPCLVRLSIRVWRSAGRAWKAWLSPSSGKNGTAYLPRAMGDRDALLAPYMRPLRLIVALTLARLYQFLKAPLRPEPKARDRDTLLVTD